MSTTVDRADRSRLRLGSRLSARLSLAMALAFGLSIVGATLTALPSAAKAVRVVATEPRAEQTVDDEPGWVTIAFSSGIDSSKAKMIVQGPDGENVTTGPLIVEGTNVTSQLSGELPQGTYTVHYRVNSSEDEIEGGAFQFAYVTGAFTTPPDRKWSGSANEPAILRGSDPNETEPPHSAPKTTPPEVEVEKSDGGTETVDPGPTPSSRPSSTARDERQSGGATGDESTGEPTASTESTTATSGSGNRLPWIVGGAVLLIAVGAGAVALGLRGRAAGSGGDSSGPTPGSG